MTKDKEMNLITGTNDRITDVILGLSQGDKMKIAFETVSDYTGIVNRDTLRSILLRRDAIKNSGKNLTVGTKWVSLK